MNRWLRLFAPALALVVVLAAAFAALGGGRVSAGQSPVAGHLAVEQVAAQAANPVAVAPQPVTAVATQPPEPTEEPKTGPDTDKVAQQDGPQSGAQDGETNDSTADAETKDSAEIPDNETADAAALASKAKITADQAKAAALAANPGASAVKVKLDDENGTIVYSVELSTGADVKVDAQSAKIVGTDQPDSEGQDGGD